VLAAPQVHGTGIAVNEITDVRQDALQMQQCGSWRPDSSGAELVLTPVAQPGHLPAETARTSTSFTIFEGTSEIQRMIIGSAVTGLDVR
jgi:hypothetical protein